MNEELVKRQEKVDKDFAENGLTDELLVEQLEINRLRYEHDIPDDSKMVFGKFVQ